ncbi:Smr protein/MutS2 C-terminal [Fulvimarina pelagi HTCC2506]|uniref:Smr protein/MutS2 C-terminal n=2 Tax=Fulvimarina pelagi TaxID=217511 RepID=Q0G2Z3_9HYPH|nr:Smr/MutS family protein [Fulvimarina pelagi]EAU42038.1 Smr protein/MutS2 C-terminal [Fulvimarina pelagi HTCC2506]BAT31008.1 Smr protein/MutS2 C-terminal [Fulvimarina pelagi]
MKRPKSLSPEDRRLWASVARTAVPLKNKAVPEVSSEEMPRPKNEAHPPLHEPRPALAPLPAKRTQPKPLQVQPTIERPTRRKISKGRIAIEARIDLHEMTQDRAHAALSNFLRQAQALGLRHVLVITGRGKPGGSRGILRRMVPLWFASTEFRALVSAFESAERHHGGEGALYVRVRRRG